HVWVFDHLASVGPDGPDRPVYESWTLQAAMAVATRHVRLECMVTGNTYRNPALQAKIAASVDHLSGGRLEFGIGAAWAEVEHQMFAIAGLDHRVGRLSESLEILRSLWTRRALRLAAIHQRSAAPCSTRGMASTAQSWWIPPADAPGAGFPSTSSLCPCATRSV